MPSPTSTVSSAAVVVAAAAIIEEMPGNGNMNLLTDTKINSQCHLVCIVCYLMRDK